MNSPDHPATVDTTLRLEGDLKPDDRDRIVASWGPLDQRLRSFRADAVSLMLTMKERDTPSQRTALEARVAGFDTFVATSTETDVERALIEVRDDLIRQLTDAKNRTEPRHNRHLRETDR
ncbi:MAG: HPF/RaiA family ribosome-associated protein [Acidimicrobiia bacterium]|nr:HPF/RaiA family ribosome-associated protein [Acidimicrobiia bacterium]